MIAKYPDIPAIAAPAPRLINALLSGGFDINSPNWRTAAPSIAGIDIINENLAIFSLSTPSAIPAKIVDPDLERPGKIAHACAHPTKRAFVPFNGLFF